MKISKENFNKILFGIVVFPILLLLAIVVFSQADIKGTANIEGGIQNIYVEARNGYNPNLVEAKAGVESQLVLVTNNTYDCSAAIIIPELDYQAFLPPSGETIIKIPPQAAGSEIQGACSMGHYGFRIKFS